MRALIPLDPAPVVPCPPLQLVAVDAGRTAAGIAATIQAVNGSVQAARLVRLADQGSRRAFVQEVAEKSGLPVQQVDLALLELLGGVEMALRGAARRSCSAADEPKAQYVEGPTGLIWLKPTANGPVPTQLTNFRAKIVREVEADDGLQSVRTFDMEATRDERTYRFQVSATQFANMAWVPEHLGASAITFPGAATKDHARAAIQVLSGEVPLRRVYAHSGWRRVDGQWAFLHSDGAIGPHGALPGVEVGLSGSLSNLVLPDPPEGQALLEAIRESLELLRLAPDRIVVPLFGAVWRAPLCVAQPADLALHLVGHTGAFKSELAALAQQHFGPGFDRLHLPASWSSTENALERQVFEAKDAILTVDDFAPTGSGVDIARIHAKADRLIRGVGNRSGRGRMHPDGRLRKDYPPRGLVLSTGEDTPRGHSLRSRMLTLEVGRGDVDKERLTIAQRLACQGAYATAMAGYLRHLAGRLDHLCKEMPGEIVRLREAAQQGAVHQRTPDAVASLGAAWKVWLDFALEAGAIDTDGREALWRRVWRALAEAAAAQSAFLDDQEIAAYFVSLLRAALISGAAHLVRRDGGQPEAPEAWGWQRPGTDGDWRPRGASIGWVDGSDVYLEPQAAYICAQRLARDGGGSLPVTLLTLKKRLYERGLLASVDSRAATTRLEVRRVLGGQRREVLHLAGDSLICTEVSHVSQTPLPDARSRTRPAPPKDRGPDRTLGTETQVDSRAVNLICADGWEEGQL